MSSTFPSISEPIAILSALAQEQHGLIGQLQHPRRVVHAGRDFWLGHLHGWPVVLALSKIGKVAAATTATALIERFGIRQIVFTGVAGGLAEAVDVGDVVVASHFMQHDLDVSPLFPRYEVPLYGQTCFAGDLALTDLLFNAAAAALEGSRRAGQAAGVPLPFPTARVHCGLIASGDHFVCGVEASSRLKDSLASAGHAALAVEMEGAAVAQVCLDYGVPFAAVRTISDRADDNAHVDFNGFIEKVASRYAQEIIGRFFELLSIK